MTEILNLKYIDKELIEADVEFEEGNDMLVERMYLGSVFNIMPSGKYYMPWTTNQTEDDIEKDTAFMEQIELELDTIGACLIFGDGDPTDLFVERVIDTS